MKLLNLGCGGHFHPDWINADLMPISPEVMKIDLSGQWPFGKNKFDVVYHCHVLEHLPRQGAPVFISKCLRVLKPGGRIRVVVPDFEQIALLYLENLSKAVKGDQGAMDRYRWMQLELFDQMVREKPGGDMLEYWRQDPLPAESFIISRCGREVTNYLEVIRSSETHDSQEKVTALDQKTQNEHERIGKFRSSGEVHKWMYDRLSLSQLLETAGFCQVRICRAEESGIEGFNDYGLDVDSDGFVRRPESLYMEAVKQGGV